MAKLYMMRHGQTLFNVLRRKQGWCDSPLTDLGIEQAKRAGAWFREQSITFDHAYSSTSERACDTMELVAPGMPYERVKGLKEWNFGKFEGVTEDLNIQPPYRDFYVQFGGEDEMAFRERLLITIHELMSREGHESVLMTSHGAACAQVLRAINNDYLLQLRDQGKRIGNCAIVIYDYDRPAGTLAVEDVINPNG